MKILQVAQFFSPVHGGSAEIPYQLSKELAKRGHEITIYASDYKSSQEYITSIPEVEVCLFKSWLNYAKFHVTPGIIKRAKKEIKQFDIIHMHNYRTFQNVVAHHYAKKYEVPYVLQARGSIPRFKTKKILKELFDIFWGYRILKDANKLIFSTKLELKKCEEDINIDKNKIEIVPNGIDLSEYSNLPEKGEFRRKYRIKDDEKMILYLGRIDEIKGINLLVEAFSDLRKELDDVKLVIAGPDDGFLSTLKRQIEDLNIGDKVLFTGPLFKKDKLRVYVDADIFVLPSKYESFGNVAMEACACGTPVIVTDRCGIAEFVDKAGYVVEYDKDRLRNALFKILSDEELRRRFGEEGRKLVREYFNWNNIIRKIEEVYETAQSK